LTPKRGKTCDYQCCETVDVQFIQRKDPLDIVDIYVPVRTIKGKEEDLKGSSSGSRKQGDGKCW
jgi:hypothetical protein